MDDKLINAYISNLAQEVQSLKMENILLKTRIGILESEKQQPVQPEANGGDFSTPEPEQKKEQKKVNSDSKSKLKPNELGSARNKDGNFSQG